MATATVLILEDDLYTRTTLSSALKGFNIEVVAATGTPKEALEFCKTGKVEVALVDLDLGPGPTGMDLAYLMRKVSPQIGIIFVTSYSDPRLLGGVAQALPVGARYITKSTITDMSQLVDLIHQVRRFPLKSNQGSTSRSDGPLTDRQIEVLKLVADGMSTVQISQTLGVSEKAVEATISRLNNSLGISKSDSKNLRVQLVRAYFTLTGKKPPRE